MRSIRWRVFVMILAVLMMLPACGSEKNANAIDEAVLNAWTGSFSIENRKNAIETYAKKYIPVYAGNLDGETVSFTIDFKATDCGAVTLAPVNDSVKDGELNTIVDFVGEAQVKGNVVTVDIGWWYTANASVKNHQQWAYLFWIKDEAQVNHYYYFRIDYAK